MLAIDADRLDIDPVWLVDALAAAHRHGMGSVERTLIEDARGEETDAFLVWSAWRPGEGLAAKLVTVFPGNEGSGKGDNIHSVVVLFDGEDGRPLAAITGESFTRMKTAADSALGARFLAREDAAVLAVLGAGSQAETQARYLKAVRPSIREVKIWNRTPAKAAALAGRLALPGVSVVAVADAAAAVAGADVVTCVTAATEPVLSGAWLEPGAHVDLVGSFTPAMREADDEVMRRGRIFVDTRRFTVPLSGDLSQPFKTGLVRDADIVGDLFELCAGRILGRRSPQEITVYKNGGGGHLDLMVARALYDRAGGPQDAPWAT
jgi:ornithine cyclodeaminase/alanine dehydrogenase-like protein (mu-crystallin family)